MKKTIKQHQKIIMSVFFGLFINLLLPFIAQSQNLQLKGKVISSTTQEAVPGVNVVQKGTTLGTLTDEKGEFTISVPIGSTLVFSFIGMKTQEVQVTGNASINVKMEDEVELLEQVVVTGYSTQRKVD